MFFFLLGFVVLCFVVRIDAHNKSDEEKLENHKLRHNFRYENMVKWRRNKQSHIVVEQNKKRRKKEEKWIHARVLIDMKYVDAHALHLATHITIPVVLSNGCQLEGFFVPAAVCNVLSLWLSHFTIAIHKYNVAISFVLCLYVCVCVAFSFSHHNCVYCVVVVVTRNHP